MLLQGILVSPHLLYRVETGGEESDGVSSSTTGRADAVHRTFYDTRDATSCDSPDIRANCD